MDGIELAYDDRHRRRLVLQCKGGTRFLLDLKHAQILHDGEGLLLDNGSIIIIHAALEDVAEIRCATVEILMHTAWHLGNRHLPCEIHQDRLVVRWDPVIAVMLEKRGCSVARINAPFNPEGGAYETAHDHGRNHD